MMKKNILTALAALLIAIFLDAGGGSMLGGGAMLQFSSPAMAVEPDEILDDPVLEARARRISKGLRCLVCQNESIDESNADLAKDLRILLRERLKKGDSDEQAVQYIVDRYGEFVLLQPRFEPSNLVLWLGPLLILALALFFLYKRARTMPEVPQGTAQELSEQEKEKLEKLLAND